MLFSDIYTKAIALFDDPKITVAYNTNKIQFYKLMYTYMQNAIALFNNPAMIGMMLANYEDAEGSMEVWVSEGREDAPTFSLDPEWEIKEGSVFQFVEGERIVKGIYNAEDHTVQFPDALPEGMEYAFEAYYPGGWGDEIFSGFNMRTTSGDSLVQKQIKDILARLLVKAWAEEERNLLLDIRNIMQDSDFKITGNDRILKSKNEWVDQLDTEVLQLQNKLSWNIRFMNGSKTIGRG